jgi:hypothetical protein
MIRSVTNPLYGMTCALLVFSSAAAYAGPDAGSVAAPAGTQRVATLAATGVQVYSCEFDASHRLGWAFKRPDATLYDANGRAVVHHGAGPSWQADDHSRIVGRAVGQAASQTPGSIPQLLLETKSTGPDGMLSGVRYVQRLDTVGGAAPASHCLTEHQVGESPYFAHYTFLK